MSYALSHSTKRTVSAGKFYPLGATLTHEGVNFALYSAHAHEVFLLLFGRSDGEPTDIIRMENRDRNVWHCLVHGVKAGQLYGYKVRGPFDPWNGLRFNENKLLIDPYAKALSHEVINTDNLLLAYDINSPEKDVTYDARDNTRIVPKCVVIDDAFDWKNDAAPDIPFERLVVYETHLKGFTAHASSKAKHAGTYLGFMEKIPYLKELGVNAVELLPVHSYVVEDFLRERKLTNYWGYNTIAFFAPHLTYGSRSHPGAEVQEFKTLVRELHRNGIEVILDVVYNHTAEGNEMGPTLSLKGIDNPTYYCLSGGRYYMNYTGCGNSVNLTNTPVIRLVLDSLRYWVQEMHVDGFRFDLASVLGREDGSFQRSSAFFDSVSQDPLLSRVKLIAEPWDLGTYQVGNFPAEWAEWNGRFRDTVRRFVKGDSGQLRELGFRLTGSSDLYGDDGRSAYNSVNFVTCHDGFTQYDLVAYNGKHNEANGENNNDGSNDNASWNCGAEGETGDEGINEIRMRQMKNFASILLLSAGTPMILAGDEFANTQGGNNNAYCQDNAISWLDWSRATKYAGLREFYRKLIAFRLRHAVFTRKNFYTGRDSNGNHIADLSWFGPELDAPYWDVPEARYCGMLLDATESGDDCLFFIMINADWQNRYFKLPDAGGRSWARIVDTSLSSPQDFLDEEKAVRLNPADHYIANGRSVVVLKAR